jgi:hypothetical protein
MRVQERHPRRRKGIHRAEGRRGTGVAMCLSHLGLERQVQSVERGVQPLRWQGEAQRLRHLRRGVAARSGVHHAEGPGKAERRQDDILTGLLHLPVHGQAEVGVACDERGEVGVGNDRRRHPLLVRSHQLPGGWSIVLHGRQGSRSTWTWEDGEARRQCSHGVPS